MNLKFVSCNDLQFDKSLWTIVLCPFRLQKWLHQLILLSKYIILLQEEVLVMNKYNLILIIFCFVLFSSPPLR